MKAKELEGKLRELLQTPLSDETLRSKLEELAMQPAFSGFTWLWGPELYNRNRVMFRPFILSHFSSFLVDPPDHWNPIPWKKRAGQFLDQWLEQVDRHDDIELFRRLYQWKISSPGRGPVHHGSLCEELLERFHKAPSPAARRLVLAKFDFWFRLDEPTAMELYKVDLEAAKPFILKHLPTSWWGGEKRALWANFCELAEQRGDKDFYFALYRKQVPLKRWQKDVLALCDTFGESQKLLDTLEQHHPEGYGLDLGDTFYRLVEKQGPHVLPYVMKHLKQVWSGSWFRSGYDKMLDLARKREWFDLWAALLRICAQAKEYNREVGLLLDDPKLTDRAAIRRLLMLSGVSREWNLPGLSFARVQQLDERIALKFYERFPDLLRGPFKMNISPTWRHAYPRLVKRLTEEEDETLIDFMASRLVARGGFWADKEQLSAAETLADYYESLRKDALTFSRRACAVLSQIPAYAIYDYNAVIRDNRLARLLFERSSSSYLADPAGVQDLLEAPEIHVQILAYRALGLTDDRARHIAADNLDILLGTLLRALHRKTRLLAFGALLNAATTLSHARRIHDRAREALDLPDIRYPKEKLVGLIGQILKQWPELRCEGEQPLVFGEAG
jgi:hypothetical protein